MLPMSPQFNVTVTCKNIDVYAVIGFDMDGDSLYLESAHYIDNGQALSAEESQDLEVELAAIQKLEDERIDQWQPTNWIGDNIEDTNCTEEDWGNDGH